MKRAGIIGLASLTMIILITLYLVTPVQTFILNGGQLFFPLDDSYIHLAFAKTFSESGTFGIRDGSPIGASTAPLWSLWLVPAFTFGCSPEWWALGWALVFHLLSFGLLYYLSRESGYSSFLSWTAVFLYGSFYASFFSVMTGMEIPLANCVMILLFILLMKSDRPVLWGFLLAVLALLRPEFLLLFFIATVMFIWTGRWSFRMLIFPCLILIPYHGWLWWINGYPLPTTFFAKVPSLISHTSPVSYLSGLVSFFFGISGPVILMGFPGLILLFKKKLRIPSLWAISLIIWFMFTGKSSLWTPLFVGNFGRYLMIIIPVLILASVHLIHVFLDRFQTGLSRIVTVSAITVVVFWPLIHVPGIINEYRTSCRNMADGDIMAARWVSSFLPPEAELLVHDVGAMAYFTPNPLVDMVGIMTPEVIQHRRDGSFWDFLENRKPRYFIYVEGWEVALGHHIADFKIIHQFQVPDPIIYPGNTIFVCETPWQP